MYAWGGEALSARLLKRVGRHSAYSMGLSRLSAEGFKTVGRHPADSEYSMGHGILGGKW
jgi:hypothetical protein